VVGLAGVAAAAVLFFGVFGLVDDLTQGVDEFVTPGSRTLELGSGEGRTIYEQVKGRDARGRRVSSRQEGIPECRVTRRGGGGSVAVSSSGGFTLSLGDDEYVSRLNFEAPREGAYEVRCRDSTDPRGEIPLAVGPRIRIGAFVARILGFFAALFGGPLVGGGIAGLVAALRDSSRRRLEQQAIADAAAP
jgi:hypothetical protein